MSNNALEVNYETREESQPLLEEEETKPEADTQLVSVQEARRTSPPSSRGVSILFLDPDAAQSTGGFVFNAERSSYMKRRLNAVTENMSSTTRKHLGDVGRGCLMVIATPFLIVALALYTAGTILEGIAMVMKGVSAVGGNFIVRSRGSAVSPSVMPSEWV